MRPPRLALSWAAAIGAMLVDYLCMFLGGCWQEAVEASTPGSAVEEAEVACSGTRGARLAWATDGEALGTQRENYFKWNSAH